MQVIYCVLFLLSVFRKFFLILSASSTTLVAEYSLSLVAFALFVRSAKWLRTRTQNPVVVIPCRFDSDRRHQKRTQVIYCVLFLLSVSRKFFLILSASSTTLVAEYSLSLVAFALFVRSAKWLRTRTQNPVVVIPCRFDSDRRHQKRTQVIYCVLFLLSVSRKFFLILSASSTTLVAEYSLSLVAFALFVRSAKWLRTRTQNPVVVIPCRFDSDRRHQKNLIVFDLAFV